MSEEINDGGPAFPEINTSLDYDRDRESHFPNTYTSGGMSLRDWFAGMALQGIYASDAENRIDAPHAAVWAYDAADAMIAERSKPQNAA